MHNFKELKVWNKARILVKEVYELTSTLPNDEKYGLISQMKRASISISSNIAEGAGRGSKKDFSRFLNISLGSAYELETQMILAFDLKMINEDQLNNIISLVSEVQKMIYNLIRSMEPVTL